MVRYVNYILGIIRVLSSFFTIRVYLTLHFSEFNFSSFCFICFQSAFSFQFDNLFIEFITLI